MLLIFLYGDLSWKSEIPDVCMILVWPGKTCQDCWFPWLPHSRDCLPQVKSMWSYMNSTRCMEKDTGSCLRWNKIFSFVFLLILGIKRQNQIAFWFLGGKNNSQSAAPCLHQKFECMNWSRILVTSWLGVVRDIKEGSATLAVLSKSMAKSNQSSLTTEEPQSHNCHNLGCVKDSHPEPRMRTQGSACYQSKIVDEFVPQIIP